MVDLFKHPSYKTHRPLVLKAYVDQQVRYLSLKYPDRSVEELQNFVKKIVDARLKDPQIEIIRHPSPGNSKRERISLIRHLSHNIKQNIISPSGACYVPPTVKESFLKISLAEKLKERKVYKKLYLEAKESGDVVVEANNNLLQATTKIFANSAPGAMQSPFNILYDKPGFNAITSIARLSVRYGYAHVERMIEGNLYLTSYNDFVAYCVRLIDVIPPQITSLIDTWSLTVPTVEMMVDYFTDSLKYYLFDIPCDDIRSFLSRLTPEQRCFVYYAGCLKNLVFANDHIFRPFFKMFFQTEFESQPQDRPEDVYQFEADLLAMAVSLNFELFGRNERGDRYNLEDAIKHRPDQVRLLLQILRHMDRCLTQYADLFSTFLRIETDIARIHHHPNMIRRCVVVSDTDSVIFTTQRMVEWYSGSACFAKTSYEINAFTVYVVSRSLEHVFSRLSCGFGMVGQDIKLIAMKNEFLYPAMLKTPNRKHYVGMKMFQEGRLLPKLEKDIKGLGFRSSTLSSFTNSQSDNFLIDLMTQFINTNEISATQLLHKVADFEATLYRSLMNGERYFLQTVSIKNKTDYEDPMQSWYFYYELWQRVFGHKFDKILLPNKCFKLPLLASGKILKSEAFLESLKAFDQRAHDNLLDFIQEYHTRPITSLLVPPTLATIPEIFRQLIDVRSIIHTNASPFYLTLSSLGLCFNYDKESYVVSDFFNPHQLSIPLSL